MLKKVAMCSKGHDTWSLKADVTRNDSQVHFAVAFSLKL